MTACRQIQQTVGKKRYLDLSKHIHDHDCHDSETSKKASVGNDGSSVKYRQWTCMFNIRTSNEIHRKPRSELFEDVASQIASKLLRDHVTMPAHPDKADVSISDRIIWWFTAFG